MTKDLAAITISNVGYTGEQKREYQRKWMQDRRDKAIAYLGSSCVLCGSNKNLEFDHVERSSKSSNVSWLLSRRWEVQVIELDKCQLLCEDCHKAKTKKEIPEWRGQLSHGTHSMYTRGCRCFPCKNAHKELARVTRAAGKKW